MNKTDFVDATKNLQRFDALMEPYEKVLKDDGPWCDLYTQNVSLIADAISEKFDVPEEYASIYGDIEYFVFELLFGRDFQIGMVIDADGSQPDFSTAEKLYDYFEGKYKK